MYPRRTGMVPQADIPKEPRPLVRGPNSWLRSVALGSALVLVTGLMVGTVVSAPAQAADNPTVISLTFDDTNAEQVGAAATMNELGLPGTFYVNSGWIGQDGYMTQAQLLQLQAAGNEIGGHTVDHADLTTLSADEAKREVCNDRTSLMGLGFQVRSFAYPFAATNAALEGTVQSCGYNSARGLGDLKSTPDTDPNGADLPWAAPIPSTTPYNLAAPTQVSSAWDLAALQASVTNAEGTGGWVPLTFHHIVDSTVPDYDPSLSISPAVFTEFVTWLAAQQSAGTVTVKTVGEVIGGDVKPAVPGPDLPPPPPAGTNMIQNPGMETLAGGTPECWSGTGFGVNTVDYSVVSPGHSGNNAGHAVMVAYTDGDGKFLQSMDTGTCSPAGTEGHTYTLSAWYTSTVVTQFEIYFKSAAGAWDFWTASPTYVASSDWTQVTWTTPPLPAGATGISWGLNIFSVGTITTDDYSMIDVTNQAEFTAAPVPTITGTPVSGQQLTAATGTWAPAPDALAYQWSANGAAITGATASTYTPTSTDVGKTITVTVTGTKAGYVTTAKTSTATAAVTAAPPTEFTAAPVPTVTGTPVSGQQLTAATGTWAPAPDALAYQWNANGAAITGATASTYTPTTTDVGKTITVTVTATKAGYTTTAKTSAATAKVTAAGPTEFTAAPVPTITGTPVSGQQLTATTGIWAPAPVTLTRQWKANDVAIAGATASTYTPASTDVGKTITVTVTGTKAGYVTTAKTSAATAKVTAPPKALTATPVPKITGVLVSGHRLTAAAGTWAPAPVTLTRQWKRNGVAITGATASTYLLTGTDVGKTITVTVTGTKAGYQTTAKTSAATAKVTAPPKALTATPVPKITGVAVNGQRLTAVTGNWAPAPVTLTRQWKRNGVAVKGATASSYKLTSSDIGKVITVTVTGAKTGYVTATKTSAAVVPKARVTRIGGADRYAVSAAVSKSTFAPGVSIAYVASGAVYPDALSGGAAAAKTGSPVLLAATNGITPEVKTELNRLKPKKIIVLGGTGTLTNKVLNDLKKYSPTVTRIGGADRYVVSAAVSKSTFSPGASIAYVASGAVYPDALSGGAAAAKTGSPVLLAATNGITPEVRAELARLKPKKIVVLGGTGTLTNKVVNDLKKYSATVTRIGGADRYAVSAAVSKSAFSPGVNIVYVASGAVFPDALSGSAAAGKTGSPVLLSAPNVLPDIVKAELKRLKPKRIIVLGGTGTLSNSIQRQLDAYIG